VWRPHNWVDGRDYRAVQQEKLKTCGRPFKTPLQVQVDGTVNMCCFDFDGKLLLGDLKDQTLKEIFQSDMYKKIVECHTTGKYENSGLICKNCDQRNVDKSDVMVYNSKFAIEERVKKVSTTYSDIV
jgi:radical SAM protein with 4Fe4S-binding SPASM domain